MPSLEPLDGDVLIGLLNAHASGLTSDEFYDQFIAGSYKLKKESFGTKVSNEKNRLKILASTYVTDDGEMTGEEIIAAGLVEKYRDIPKEFDYADDGEFDISTVIPNFVGGGQGRGTRRSTASDLLNSLKPVE
jgi:hypothetical protein